jgi:hypothetical protein
VSNSEQTIAVRCAFFAACQGESARVIANSDRWIELLTCSNCGMSGSARLSRPEKRAYDFSVDAIPPGFKIVRVEFGKTFFCEACNQPADTR